MITRRPLLAAPLAAAAPWPRARATSASFEFGVLEVAPYAIHEPGKPLSGLYVELLERIIERAGVRGRVRLFPLARVRQKVEDGTLAATLAIPDARLLAMADSAAEVAVLQSVVVGRAPEKVDCIAELRERKVCLLRGSSFEPRLYADSRIELTELSDYASCVAMLQAGRVDFIAAPRVGLWWLVRSGAVAAAGLGAPYVLNERAVHVLVSKKHAGTSLARSLAEGVRLARADRSIDAIMTRYGQ